MTKSSSQERVIGAQSSTLRTDRSRILPTIGSPPLPAAEIESLLRLARENRNPSKTAAQDEEIGPGDVQYLRGDSMTDSKIEGIPTSNWLESTGSPDSLLRQAEQHLAEAILDSRGESSNAGPLGAELAKKPVGTSSEMKSRQGLTLEDLGNVELDISIELGRAEILIEDVLKLREGSVVSLDKLAGDPVDIVANGRLVARGELLVIDGKFGVRLSEVL